MPRHGHDLGTEVDDRWWRRHPEGGPAFNGLPEHRQGWDVVGRSEGMRVLERGERRIVVTQGSSGGARLIGYAGLR